MSDAELIVRFSPGVEESEARKVVESLGCGVRRRMRDDHPSIVTFIVRGPSPAIETALDTLGRRSDVDHVERNGPDHHILD